MTLVVTVTDRGANRKYDVKKTILLEITMLFFLVSMFPFWRCVALLDRIFAQKSQNTKEGPAFHQKPRVEKWQWSPVLEVNTCSQTREGYSSLSWPHWHQVKVCNCDLPTFLQGWRNSYLPLPLITRNAARKTVTVFRKVANWEVSVWTMVKPEEVMNDVDFKPLETCDILKLLRISIWW